MKYPVISGALLLTASLLFVANQSADTSVKSAGRARFPSVFLTDVVVSNTDRDLRNTDKFFNAEPGIAINPADPRRIVISAFSGAWSKSPNGQFQNAPLWYTRDGGNLWTKEFSIPVPPGVDGGLAQESPCDETFDYDRRGVLYGTFLLSGNGEGANCSSDEGTQNTKAEGTIVSGATNDPGKSEAWGWLVVGGKTKPTNQHTAPDQPWLAVNKSLHHPQIDNVYVGYQSTTAVQVAVAEAKVPPDFTIDKSTGSVETFGGNAAQRVAVDQRSGAIYSLHQTRASLECPRASAVSYVLNRSLDGGRTWGLNGNPNGIQVAEACSNQDIYTYSFGEIEPGTILGGVNVLRGGVNALAVHLRTGDVYVAFGKFDQSAGRDRIAMVRVVYQSNGTMLPGTPQYVSGPEHQSALPAVAVTDNGAVGVLYDTADALDPETSKPYFSVYLAVSRNQGASFETVRLQRFLFAGKGSGNAGPRPLGDYQQLKSLGQTFFGVFSGDGQPFGRPFHKIDPIFLRATVE
jgi:hypothetical protein